jgi:DNA-binding SARP family transcriptional activator
VSDNRAGIERQACGARWPVAAALVPDTIAANGLSELRVEFRILGPLEISAGTERVELGGTRQQIVLAALLLSANRMVTIDRLVEAIYGEDPPPTARMQAQISISSLRQLFASHGRAAVIATRAHGYEIQVSAEKLDAQRFTQLLAAGVAAREAGQADRAVASYRDALRLWRGPALDGMESQLLRAAARRLDEQRIAAFEDRITLELELGRHHELVGELTELAAEYPLRERLRGQLMLALYRCDRTAEALAVYRETRRIMIDELGIEPGERLRQIEQAILTADPSLGPPVQLLRIDPDRRQVPGMLPADIADFTGRTEEIDEVRRRLIPGQRDQARLAVPVVVITGRGGVGKTSLAVHASHDVEGHFPDGQLFANLHGGAHPVGPMRVLERFLRALGVPGPQLPDDLDERAEMYRGLLVGRKVLVVLDDAASESQVSPLLPGSQTAAVIITSRSMLAGLAGATRIELDAFEAGKSLDLLARIAGPERVRAQSEEAVAVAEQCGHLPLALRIAGARLAARPHWSIGRLADRLADETRRLDELSHGDMAVRPTISVSYEGASEEARRLLRRLALLDQPVFSGWMGAALLDQPVEQAENLLDELVSSQLIETTASRSGRHSQYRFHDLIRGFARERLATEDSPAERNAALERALGALLHLAREAFRSYRPDYFPIPSDARRWPLPRQLTEKLVSDPVPWYETERAALLAGIRQAARAGLTEICWGLTYSAVPLFESRAYLDDWRETHDIALGAARRAHDAQGEAVLLCSMAELHTTRQQFGQARRAAMAAARLSQEIGNEHRHAISARIIAFLDRKAGRLDDATRALEQALPTFRKMGDNIACADVLQSLAGLELDRGKPGAARELLPEALRLSRHTGYRRCEAQVLYRMGEACLLAGQPDGAIDAFRPALLLVRDIGDLIGEAYILSESGVARVRRGEFDEAREALQRAAELAVVIGDRFLEAKAVRGLSELALASGDPERAVAHARQAAGILRSIGTPLEEARALTILADAHTARGETEAAEAATARAAAARAEPAGGAEAQAGSRGKK